MGISILYVEASVVLSLSTCFKASKPTPIQWSKLPAADKRIEVLYKDEDIAIIHKPHELLSVPGKSVHLSVFTQASALFPDATTL
jgi:23S rRNA-/tRNA-specific pseudouridylate synthase